MSWPSAFALVGFIWAAMWGLRRIVDSEERADREHNETLRQMMSRPDFPETPEWEQHKDVRPCSDKPS